ncbi:response regulator [Fusibacter sp. JL298sf-3]
MRVLIVEDDPMVRSINAGFLRKVDPHFDIREAATIDQAKGCIEKNKIDLVLLDVYLGEESGPDLLKWIRGEGLDMDVVLITADNSAQTVETVFRLGAVDYLIKPFNYDRFKEAIVNALSRRQIKEDHYVSQAQLDDIIRAGVKREVRFEKGVNQSTYERVRTAIAASDEPLTAQEISARTDLARVTVRRYLEHMLEEGLVTETFQYGKVGRPQKAYCWIKEKARDVKK